MEYYFQNNLLILSIFDRERLILKKIDETFLTIPFFPMIPIYPNFSSIAMDFILTYFLLLFSVSFLFFIFLLYNDKFILNVLSIDIYNDDVDFFIESIKKNPEKYKYYNDPSNYEARAEREFYREAEKKAKETNYVFVYGGENEEYTYIYNRFLLSLFLLISIFIYTLYFLKNWRTI